MSLKRSSNRYQETFAISMNGFDRMLSALGLRRMRDPVRPRTKVILLVRCFLAVNIASLGAAASAQAVEFIWKVNTNKLNAGQTRKLQGIKLAKGVLKIHGTDAKNNAYEVECTTFIITPGTMPEIFGGKPGKSKDSFQFEGCTIPKPGGCKVKGGTIKTVAGLEAQIVEGVGASAGKILYVFFEPNLGFATIETEGVLCALEANNVVTGKVLAQSLGPKEELLVQDFKFEPAQPRNFSVNGAGCTHRAGLSQPGKVAPNRNSVTLEGEVSMELNPMEVFGPF